MANRRSQGRYTGVAQLLHWVIAALIVTQFVLAWTAEDLPLGMHKLALYARHKSFGMTVLILAVARLAWRLTHRPPPLPGGMTAVERILAHLTHGAFYVLLFAMPLTGWMMSSAKNYSVSWFGLFTWPNLVQQNDALFEALKSTHDWLSWALFAVALLHILAALKHHFWNKDDVLRRMLPFRNHPLAALAAVSLAALLAGATARAAPPGFTADAATSHLDFTGVQAGAEFKGTFHKFDATVEFAPDALATSRFDVHIDLDSVDSKDKDRDKTLRGPDIFDVAHFPTAHYVTRGFTRTATGYTATGSLTLHGVTRDVPLDFKFVQGGPGAKLEGTAELKRLEFGVGQGDWKSTEWVADKVKVAFSLDLKPRP